MPQIQDIPLSEILMDKKDNPRIKYENLPFLRQSIAENGFDPAHPLKLSRLPKSHESGKKYRLDEGFTRYLAAEHAKLDKAPSVVVDCDDFRRLIGHIISNSGAPLSQLEQGKVYSEMRDYGTDPEKLSKGEELREKMGNQDIAKYVGKSSEHVRNCILIFESPAEIRELIESGSVSANAIIAASKNVKEAKTIRKILDAAVENANGKQATDKHVKAVKEQFVDVKFSKGKKSSSAGKEPANSKASGAKSEDSKLSLESEKSGNRDEGDGQESDKQAAGDSNTSEAAPESGSTPDAGNTLLGDTSSKKDHIVSIITKWCDDTDTIVSDEDINSLADQLSEVF